jgi:hypothetical protein
MLLNCCHLGVSGAFKSDQEPMLLGLLRLYWTGTGIPELVRYRSSRDSGIASVGEKNNKRTSSPPFSKNIKIYIINHAKPGAKTIFSIYVYSLYRVPVRVPKKPFCFCGLYLTNVFFLNGISCNFPRSGLMQ